MSTYQSAASVSQSGPKDWIQEFFKFGHIAKGIVYCLIGGLTLATALGTIGGGPEGPRGVIQFVQDQPFGRILVGLLALGLFSYFVWRWFKAIRDPENEGSDAKGSIKRIGYAASGTFYGLLGVYATSAALGNQNGNTQGSAKESVIAEILAQSWGVTLIWILGIIFLGTGLYQLYRGVSEKFLENINTYRLDSKKLSLLKNFGKAGHVARAVTFGIISYFLFLTATTADTSKVRGLEGAFEFLSNNSYGIGLLSIVALGMICYGLFMYVKAFYSKLA